ncbi:MAG TPA: hypothetical protein VMQ86_05130 [Bryobacteraceae bacterium]|jgi:type II secretory pathway component GspD/PulD (secretin)|nr:hypothetical protein [Bryobacteraceae bacterium]
MRFLWIALAASTAFGQASHVFKLTQGQDAHQVQEMAVLLRGTGKLGQVSVDAANETVLVAGTPGQVAVANWLVHQLDVPASVQVSGIHEYRPPETADDVVRVFYVNNAVSRQDLQEIVTAVRSVADVQRLFVYNALNAVAARGNRDQMALSAWLIDQLDRPAGVAAPGPNEYKYTGNEVARVFELRNAQTAQQLQEMVTLIRSIGDIMRLFVNNERRAIVLRATPERVGLAAWLVHELDKPVAGQAATGDAGEAHEYRLSDDPENLVRVFYLGSPQPPQDLSKVFAQVRANTGIRRLFVYSALDALAVRGTAGQVATAEKVLEEMKVQ